MILQCVHRHESLNRLEFDADRCTLICRKHKRSVVEDRTNAIRRSFKMESLPQVRTKWTSCAYARSSKEPNNHSSTVCLFAKRVWHLPKSLNATLVWSNSSPCSSTINADGYSSHMILTSRFISNLILLSNKDCCIELLAFAHAAIDLESSLLPGAAQALIASCLRHWPALKGKKVSLKIFGNRKSDRRSQQKDAASEKKIRIDWNRWVMTYLEADLYRCLSPKSPMIWKLGSKRFITDILDIVCAFENVLPWMTDCSSWSVYYKRLGIDGSIFFQ